MDESQPQTLDEAQQLIDALRASNAQLTETVTDLQSQVAWMKRQLFGRKSERLTDAEQATLFGEVLRAEQAPGAGSEGESAPATPIQTVTYQRQVSKRGKRQPIPDHVPRVDRIHDLPAQEKAGLKCIGQRITEELEMEPGKLYAVRHIQYTYAREQEDLAPKPEQPNVITAEKPTEGLPRCLAGPKLLAMIVVSKFADHLPLHRLEGILKRDGMHLARSSMCRWVQELAVMVQPLLDLMKSQVLESHHIRGDETPVKEQEPGSGRRKTKTSYFYCYLGDANHPYTLYDYRGHRARAGPNAWFSDEQGDPRYHGLLQCDAYTGYHELFDPNKPWQMTPVGCWAHARRRFYDVRDQFPGPCHHVLGQIRQLYAVEREAKELTTAQRLALRDQKSRPIVEALFTWAEEQQRALLPKSGLGEAITYLLNQAEALKRYLDDGQLEIDNSACERSLRGIAVGRANWLFTGSQAGGEAAAAMFSLIASAKRHGLNPWHYLADVFRRLPSTPTSQLDQFLPDRWQAPNS